MANFEEALAGMRRGEKWRREGWGSREFWRCRAGEVWSGVSEFRVISFTQDSILGQDWEPYQEPKRSLSFDEAVERLQRGEVVRTDQPASLGLMRHSRTFNDVYGDALLWLDLAERRGWVIEEAN